MNTLYLHIGTQKTATTTLQHFLADNDEVLKTKGYTYPIFTELNYPYWDTKRNGLFLGHPYYNRDSSRNYEVEERYYKTGMGKLHELFSTYPNVILSEERMWLQLFFKKGELMKKLLEDSRENGYQIKLIIYIRRQDKFVDSYWNQQVKSTVKESRCIEQYASEFKYLDYHHILQVIADVIGKENLDVVRFEEAVKGDGIIADFMRRIGLELTDEYQIAVENANSRLSGNTADIKRITNKIGALEMGDQIFLKNRIRMVAETAESDYKSSAFSEEEREEFMKRFKEGNDLIAKKFIGDGKPLFSDDYSGLPKWDKDNPEYLDDMIMTSAAGDVLLFRKMRDDEAVMRDMKKMIRKLEKHIEKQDARIEKMKAQIEKQGARIERLRHPVKTMMDKTFGSAQKQDKDSEE